MLRYLPLIGGLLVGLGIFFNRVATIDLLPSQSRSDALGIFGGAMLILVYLLGQRIQSTPPETVELEGTPRFFLEPQLPEQLKSEIAWLSHTLLSLTVTRSVVIWYDDRVLHFRGTLPGRNMAKPGKLVSNAIKQQKPLYLVQMNLYPGKIEFDYLPTNTQGLILQPLGARGILILGANAPRSYTNQDEAWINALAEKLTFSLNSLDSPVG